MSRGKNAMNMKLVTFILLLLLLPIEGIAETQKIKAFEGLESIWENQIDSISKKRDTIIIGDTVFDLPALVPVYYSSGSVASTYSLRVGQWVKIYTSQSIMESSEWPPIMQGIEIVITGKPNDE